MALMRVKNICRITVLSEIKPDDNECCLREIVRGSSHSLQTLYRSLPKMAKVYTNIQQFGVSKIENK